MIWDWSFAFEILPLLARAAVVTIEATLLGFLIAAILGLVLAVAPHRLPGHRAGRSRSWSSSSARRRS